MSSSIGGNSNGSSNGESHRNVDVKVLKWIGNIIQEDISTITPEDQLIVPTTTEEEEESPSPSRYSSSQTTHLLGKRLPKGASPAYIFSCAALYINLSIPVICHELSQCHFRTTTDAVRHLLYNQFIDRAAAPYAEAPKSLFPPDAYTIRALVTFLIRLDVPAPAIWQNVLDWSGGRLPISGGVSRVKEKRNIFEKMNRFLLMDTPPEAAKPGFELAYIDNALDLGLSPAQMVHYLVEAFPQASTWMTKEYVYDVILAKAKEKDTNAPSIDKITTGRRQWDRAGEEFARVATNVVGLSDERLYCCLLMAGYDIEYDLEFAEYFLARARKDKVPSSMSSPPPPPPPPPPAAAAADAGKGKEKEKEVVSHEKATTPPPPAAAAADAGKGKEKEKVEVVGHEEKAMTRVERVGKSLILPKRKKGPSPPFVGHDKKKAEEEKPDSYW